MRIIIDEEAKKSLRNAFLHIRKDSLQNAEKVKSKLLSAISELIKNPERYPVDKYRARNDGSYRAFEVYNYRVSYHISSSEIRVLRIRHTKMNPLEY